jgi:glycosyltransferase involved in cell wall biosynthesis
MVTLNPGDKAKKTMESIRKQSFTNYQVVVKDGGSKDGSIQSLKEWLKTEPELAKKVLIVEERDKSIYDGMNQATQKADGEYLYFLNSGDYFAHENSLKEMAEGIQEHVQNGGKSLIFYGNIFDALREQVVPSNPKIDDFACYRNVPCHQACVYHYSLFLERGYEPKFKVRGDYEHFLWSYFYKNASPQYIPVTLALYEGGGFSETPENRKRSAAEHKEITALYMKKGQLLKYRMIMMLTLAPLRTKMAESPVMAGAYNFVKKMLYR